MWNCGYYIVQVQLDKYDSSLSQVVAAVGFKGERLDIPNTVNYEVAALIEACWAR